MPTPYIRPEGYSVPLAEGEELASQHRVRVGDVLLIGINLFGIDSEPGGDVAGRRPAERDWITARDGRGGPAPDRCSRSEDCGRFLQAQHPINAHKQGSVSVAC